MNLNVRLVNPQDSRVLKILDWIEHQTFMEFDRFSKKDWLCYVCYVLFCNEKPVGCCAMRHHNDVSIQEKGFIWRRNSLYIVNTSILPSFQGLGFGRFLKSWEVAYARYHLFRRIVTNCRMSNRTIIEINLDFGFIPVASLADYYHDPEEDSLVLELILKTKK